MSRRKRQSPHPPRELPPALPERLAEILEQPAFDTWRSLTPSAVSGRVNTLRADRDAVLAELSGAGFDVTPVSWFDEAFTVPASQRAALARCPLVDDGRVYLQNLSSMLPPMCLAPQPGMEVLDLAAAPGSKTLQMAAQMRDTGRLAAVERSRTRFHKLKANCRRAGAACVRLYLKDGTVVGRLTPERFDRVLVDAPCSSEARIDPADPATAAYWSEKKIRQLAGLQRRLLASGVEALKPGGLLAYATCTFAPEENEAVVDSVLRRYADTLELLPLYLPLPNAHPGLTAWRGDAFLPELTHSARILPDGVMEGFYLALLRKTGSVAAS